VSHFNTDAQTQDGDSWWWGMQNLGCSDLRNMQSRQWRQFRQHCKANIINAKTK